MNDDLYEYQTFKEVTKKAENEEGIFIDDQRINEILNRPDGYGKDAYWSFFKLGKSPDAFKSPFLEVKKTNEIKFKEDDFLGEGNNLEEAGQIDTESLGRHV